MEEKENIIIESKSNGVVIFILILIIGIALFIIAYNLETYKKSIELENAEQYLAEFFEQRGSYTFAEHSYAQVIKHQKKGAISMYTIIVSIFFIIISIITILFTAKTKLIITDKRVYGMAGLGKRVDIPIDSISTIGTGFLKSVIIASSSGRIIFAGLSNHNDLHRVIGNLLIERQKNKNTIVQENSVADELKKYKELLDMGVVTQEEFELKKKQLLEL